MVSAPGWAAEKGYFLSPVYADTNEIGRCIAVELLHRCSKDVVETSSAGGVVLGLSDGA